MSESYSSSSNYKDLRKVVEAIEEVAADDQIKAPYLYEVAEELEESEKEVSRWTNGDYAHACRTAGYVPRQSRELGDIMEFYNKQNDSKDQNVSQSSISESFGFDHLSGERYGLTHNQAREKLGLDTNQQPAGRFYIEDSIGENLQHRVRGIHHERMDNDSRTPNNSEINQEINLNDRDIEEVRAKSGLPFRPIEGRNRNQSPLSGERENEVFDFWKEEYLNEDWSENTEDEVEAIMSMRMYTEGVSEWELNGVASKYGKWIDIDRYSE